MTKTAASALLAWALLSEMLGPGFGPGVSKDFLPLRREEESAYRFEQRTQQEYENAQAERNRKRRNDRMLFENFYRRETVPRGTSFN